MYPFLLRTLLKRQANLEGINHGVAGVVDAHDSEETAEEDDEAVVGDCGLVQGMPLELQVEVAWPDKRQHGARETADEAHEDSEVWNGYRHHNRAEDHTHSKSQTPDSQFTVQVPYGREHSFRFTFEKGLLQNIAGGVVGQGVGEDGLYDQEEVDESSEAGGREVVCDHLLGVVLERKEADVAEYGLEDCSRDVAPVQHPLELRPVDEVTFQCGEEDLGRVREHNNSKRNREVFEIQSPLNLAPSPLRKIEQAIAEDDDVDEDVGHGAPEAEHGHVMQRLEEAQRYQKDANQHHPAADVQ